VLSELHLLLPATLQQLLASITLLYSLSMYHAVGGRVRCGVAWLHCLAQTCYAGDCFEVQSAAELESC